MFRKAFVSALIVLAATSAAWAQQPKVEFTGIIGWTLADGVSGDAVKALNGQTYDRVDPKDSLNFGFSLGFFVTPSAEIGFLWRRQATELEISGTRTDTLGRPQHRRVPRLRRILLRRPGGEGPALHHGRPRRDPLRQRVLLQGGWVDGDNDSGTQFSTTWGAGLKVNASPNVGMKVGIQWTPTYIKSDAAGWWCDPWWGCYVISNAQYANQFEFVGGIAFRF